jgi:hypothetical protein
MFAGELNQLQCYHFVQLSTLNQTNRLNLQFQASAPKLAHQSNEIWKLEGTQTGQQMMDTDRNDRRQSK